MNCIICQDETEWQIICCSKPLCKECIITLNKKNILKCPNCRESENLLFLSNGKKTLLLPKPKRSDLDACVNTEVVKNFDIDKVPVSYVGNVIHNENDATLSLSVKIKDSGVTVRNGQEMLENLIDIISSSMGTGFIFNTHLN